MLDPVCEPDIERQIDDFIFICFLVGNDFIPHIPSLQAHEGAIDLIIEVYKTTFNKMGGYIVDTDKVEDKHGAYLEVARLEIFLHELSTYEERIFRKRYEREQASLQKTYREMLREASENERLELKQQLDDLFFNEERPYDSIRLGLPGWKSRFYREYFGVETSNEIGKLQNDMAQKYLEGLCWVLQCYFADIPSWSWYYPFRVAPFLSDLKGLSQFEIYFPLDKPLRPFDQLMAVLPSQRWSALPECYRKLMGREDFDCLKLEDGTNGERFLWKGISEELLLSATKVADKELTIQEARRNTTRQEKIYWNSNSLPDIDVIAQTSCRSLQKLPLSSATSGIGGWISPNDDDDSFCLPINLLDMTNNQAVSATFFNPEVVKPIPRLLVNVKIPDKTVTGADIQKRPLWHTYLGPRPPRSIAERPDTIWKPSTPVTPREEHKHAGMGWLGRGRGNATAETQLICRSSGSYGHGAGKGTAAETQLSSSGSYSYSRLVGMEKQNRGRSSRWAGAGHGVSSQSLGW